MNWFAPRPFEWFLLAEVLLYMAGILWFLWGMRRHTGGASAQPLVSVVVAARNEEARIADCLSLLAAQDYPNFEVVVVDDGSTDATAELIAGWVEADKRFKLIGLSGSGSKKAALTAAIAEAAGEVIATTDADCAMGNEWLSSLMTYLESDVGMVIGFSQIGRPGESLGIRGGYEALDFLNLMACIWGSCGRGHPMAASGQNLLFRRAAHAEVGGYEKVMHRVSGDDVLLMQMIRTQTQWRIAFASAPASFTVHPAATSWKALLNQRARWASNAPLMATFDPLFYGYMLITYGLSWCVILSPLLVLLGWVHPLLWLSYWARNGLVKRSFFYGQTR
ncbi:MAG: glycosyltransferase [Candidatus Latescibacterota bacterium]